MREKFGFIREAEALLRFACQRRILQFWVSEENDFWRQNEDIWANKLAEKMEKTVILWLGLLFFTISNTSQGKWVISHNSTFWLRALAFFGTCLEVLLFGRSSRKQNKQAEG